MPEVFDFPYQLPTKPRFRVERTRIPMGLGYIDTVTQGSAHSRADGTGSVSSHKGAWEFTVEIRGQRYSESEYQTLVDFIRDRMNDSASFYFYNAIENSNRSTWDGTTTTGRYLVKLVDSDGVAWDIVGGAMGAFVLTFEEVFA